MKKHHTPEEMRALADKLQSFSAHPEDGDNAAAMLRDIADAAEKDREDAERYRWLRCAFTYPDADILDQAIDAARKAIP